MENTAFGTKERALLLGLMTLGGSASNPELRDHVGAALDGVYRRRLNDLKLVESEKQGRAYHHTLTDRGWAWCGEELSGTAPRGGGSLGGTLYGVLATIKGYLDATDLSLAEFVTTARTKEAGTTAGTPVTEAVPDHTASATEAVPDAATASATEAVPDPAVLIRDAYWRLAREPQDWILLSRLRPLLGDVPRDDVDEALRRMERLPDVHLVPEADQKTLTGDDRAAAVVVGGVNKHLLAIEAR